MTAPYDDHLADSGDEARATGAEFCPRCGAKRVGAFRSCLSCSFDFEGPKDALFGPPPDDHFPPADQPRQPPTPAPAPMASVASAPLTAPPRPPATAPETAPGPTTNSASAPAPWATLTTPAAPWAPPMTGAAPTAPTVVRVPTSTTITATPAGKPTATPAVAPTATASPAPVPMAIPASRSTSAPTSIPAPTRPSPATARVDLARGHRGKRLAAAAAGVLLVVAVALVALGSGFGKANPAAQASRVVQPSHSATFSLIPLQAVNEACVKQLGPFVSSLERLDAGVGPTLVFKDFELLVTTAQSARGEVNISKLDPPCIAVFAGAQAVLGEHLEAYNSWNSCNATTGCTRQSIESSLEGHWANARAALSSVKASMP
jgi:hypothetical protein